MGASYGKLTRGHEEAIYEMRKRGNTGRQMREALARGVPGEPPVSVSLDRCLKVARRLEDERDDLFRSKIQDRPAPEGLRILTRRLMIIAERETLRLEHMEKRGKLDANRLAKLANAVTKLHALLERNEALKDMPDPGDRPAPNDAPSKPASTFADGLLEPGEADSAPDPDAPVADAVIKPAPYPPPLPERPSKPDPVPMLDGPPLNVPEP